MKKNKFLLLTNFNIKDSLFMINLQLRDVQFNYLIHSEDKHDTHFADLRNIKLISNRIDENTIILFYLKGALCLYLINELLKKDVIKTKTVIYIYSALLDFLSPQNPEFITHRTTVKLLKSKLDRYIQLPVFLTEEEYYRLFEKTDKNYFSGINNFRSFIISYKKLFQYLTNNLEKWKNYSQKIYLFNEDLRSFGELENKVVPERISALNFAAHLPTVIKKHLSSYNILEHSAALKKIVDDYPWLNKKKVDREVTENLIIQN